MFKLHLRGSGHRGSCAGPIPQVLEGSYVNFRGSIPEISSAADYNSKQNGGRPNLDAASVLPGADKRPILGLTLPVPIANNALRLELFAPWL